MGNNIRKYFRPSFAMGENSGDSMHAEPRFRASCHYQIFFLTRLFSKQEQVENADARHRGTFPGTQRSQGRRLAIVQTIILKTYSFHRTSFRNGEIANVDSCFTGKLLRQRFCPWQVIRLRPAETQVSQACGLSVSKCGNHPEPTTAGESQASQSVLRACAAEG